MANILDVEKWQKAIVNLETRPYGNHSMIISKLSERLFNKEISQDQYTEELQKITNAAISNSYVGTAVYLVHNDNHYLLTARHVIAEDQVTPGADPNNAQQKIFHIPNSYIGDDGRSVQTMLMNLSAGPYSSRKYAFSDPKDDLAVIYLDKTFGLDMLFIETLQLRGHVPIALSDINSAFDVDKGDEIAVFGFPAVLSLMPGPNITMALNNWQSKFKGTPTLTIGVIEDILPSEGYFFANVLISGGNSGGPIICKDKMIGIVSRMQADPVHLKATSIYLAANSVFIKSPLLIPIISKLEQRFNKVAV